MPSALVNAAIRAMLATNDRPSAAALAAGLARATAAGRWRHLTVLLSMDDKPQAALQVLPEPARADLYGALLGLAASAQQKDAASGVKWADRLDQLAELMKKAPRPGSIPLRYRLLGPLAAGRLSKAKAVLGDPELSDRGTRRAADELVKWAGGAADVPAHAARLLITLPPQAVSGENAMYLMQPYQS